jgi:hypothetical protein
MNWKAFHPLVVLVVAVVCCLLTASNAQPSGWKMTDRFYGFRYEILGDVMGRGIEESVQQSAGQLGCFGWIQKSPRKTLVGEARCSKKQGPIFEDLLRSKGSSMTVLVSNLSDHE